MFIYTLLICITINLSILNASEKVPQLLSFEEYLTGTDFKNIQNVISTIQKDAEKGIKSKNSFMIGTLKGEHIFIKENIFQTCNKAFQPIIIKSLFCIEEKNHTLISLRTITSNTSNAQTFLTLFDILRSYAKVSIIIKNNIINIDIHSKPAHSTLARTILTMLLKDGSIEHCGGQRYTSQFIEMIDSTLLIA